MAYRLTVYRTGTWTIFFVICLSRKLRHEITPVWKFQSDFKKAWTYCGLRWHWMWSFHFSHADSNIFFMKTYFSLKKYLALEKICWSQHDILKKNRCSKSLACDDFTIANFTNLGISITYLKKIPRTKHSKDSLSTNVIFLKLRKLLAKLSKFSKRQPMALCRNCLFEWKWLSYCKFPQLCNHATQLTTVKNLEDM